MGWNVTVQISTPDGLGTVGSHVKGWYGPNSSKYYWRRLASLEQPSASQPERSLMSPEDPSAFLILSALLLLLMVVYLFSRRVPCPRKTQSRGIRIQRKKTPTRV